jgi:hypothetical protein
MIKLWEHLLPLHQAVSNYGNHATLLYLSRENAKLVDEFSGTAEAVSHVRSEVKNLNKICDECVSNISNDQRLMDLKDAFSELLMFVKLSSKCVVEKIPETSTKTPDFKISHRGNGMFVELKALNMSGGLSKYKSIMTDALDGKIKQEKHIQNGSRSAMTEQVIMPYLKPGCDYDAQSTSMVVEILNQKVQQNIKPDQFSAGTTGLLIDFSEQLLLHGRPSDNLEKEFADPPDMIPQSGELWHLAFGDRDVPMKKCVSFAGEYDQDQPLQSDGILKKHPFIAGLIFHIDGEFWGAAIRRRENIQFIQFMEDLCKKVATITK